VSYFSTALNRLAERHHLKQADIVREAGLTRSHVSRIFSGDQKSVTDEDFAALLRAFRRDPHTQAELIAARCMDARIGPGAELVEITVKKSNPASSIQSRGLQQLPEVELSHETEKAFAWLRSQCPLNPELEKHLVGYAKLTGMK
jgi:transcriptional regulator with XRE-family HTH domain